MMLLSRWIFYDLINPDFFNNILIKGREWISASAPTEENFDNSVKMMEDFFEIKAYQTSSLIFNLVTGLLFSAFLPFLRKNNELVQSRTTLRGSSVSLPRVPPTLWLFRRLPPRPFPYPAPTPIPVGNERHVRRQKYWDRVAHERQPRAVGTSPDGAGLGRQAYPVHGFHGIFGYGGVPIQNLLHVAVLLGHL